jgi:SAM-dependent methyltransferase
MLRKKDYAFVAYPDLPGLTLSGQWLHREGHAIAVGEASLRMRFQAVTKVFGRFVRHDWSGKIKVAVNGQERDCFDLFSHYRFEQCLPLAADAEARQCTIDITSLGRHPASRAQQIVFLGVVLPRDEAAPYLESPERRKTSPVQPDPSFYDLQAGMVDRYADAIVARGAELEQVSERRWGKYRRRYSEMLVYASPGDKLLDVGAGFLREDFLRDTIIPSGVEYWIQDIDQRVVDEDRAVFARCGLDPKHAQQGVNSALPYPDNSFNLVFSSHCLEHSDDVDLTFAELHRVLRPDGILFFAVPIGYDDALEHIYAGDPDAWYAQTEAHGFAVINQHVGNTYTEGCHDLVIVARRL